jgi:hypothetical protein
MLYWLSILVINEKEMRIIIALITWDGFVSNVFGIRNVTIRRKFRSEVWRDENFISYRGITNRGITYFCDANL